MSQIQHQRTFVQNYEMNGNGIDCGGNNSHDAENSNNKALASNCSVNGLSSAAPSISTSSATATTIPANASHQQTQQLATTLVQYQGFGSFHSDNVEELIRLPNEQYQRPSLFPTWALTYPSYAEIKFLEAYTDNIEAQDHPMDVGVAAKNGLSRLALGLPTRRCRGSSFNSTKATSLTGGSSKDSNNNNNVNEVDNNKNINNDNDTDAAAAAALRNRTNLNEDAHERIVAFGESVSRDHFYTDTDNWCFVNHGAFGGALRGGTLIKRRWEDFMEQQPLQFVDRTVLPSIVYCLRRLATFFNCRPQDLVPASNATLALNAAVNACVRHHTDVVAYLDLEYGSVWKMLREAWNWTRCTMHEIIIYPHLVDPAIMGDDEALTQLLESKLPDQLDVMVIDHVTSNSAMMLPVFSHIIPMLRRRGVSRIVVDGAHGALQYPIDFGSLREDQLPTYYAGNLHKWMCVPKSGAFMWVHPSMQHKTHSPIVTHGARAGMLSEFAWEGTKEYGAFLTIPAILDFWERKCGVERVREYCSTLLRDADRLLCESFGVRSVPRGAPFMRLVPLPTFFNRKIFSAKFIQDTLHKVFRVEVPVKDLEGALYMRVSAFIYNDIHDYERVRDAVLKMRAVFRRKFSSFVEAKQQDSAAGSSPSALTLLASLAELLAATNAVPTNDLGKPLPVDEFENNISQEEMEDGSSFPFLAEVLEAFEMLERIQAEENQLLQQQQKKQRKRHGGDDDGDNVVDDNDGDDDVVPRSRSSKVVDEEADQGAVAKPVAAATGDSSSSSLVTAAVTSAASVAVSTDQSHHHHQHLLSPKNGENGHSPRSTNSNNNNNNNHHHPHHHHNNQGDDSPVSSSSMSLSSPLLEQAAFDQSLVANSITLNGNGLGHGVSSSSTNIILRSGSAQDLDETTQREAKNLASILVGKKPCPDSSKSGGCGVGGINTMITTAFSDTSSDDD